MQLMIPYDGPELSNKDNLMNVRAEFGVREESVTSFSIMYIET